jgi:hypothetical protein
VRYLLLACSIASLVIGATLIYYYVSFGRIIDARLQGERERSLPRVYAGRSKCAAAKRSASRS